MHDDQTEGTIHVQHDPLSAGGSSDALTGEHLKRLSLLFFQLNNEQNWDALLTADWISPRFTAAIEYSANQEREVNLKQHVAQYSQYMKENPSYIETTSEIDAKIDKFGRTAQIFINHCGNSDSGVGIPGVAVFTWWKAKSGKWLFVKMIDIRGMGS